MSEVLFWENVERYYGSNEELMVKYRAIRATGQCPFCEPVRLEGVMKTDYWVVVKNDGPYTGARPHLLVLPKRHVVILRELTATEWTDLQTVFEEITEGLGGYPLLDHGCGFAFRSGRQSGATVKHLHGHIIRPSITGESVVNFPIG